VLEGSIEGYYPTEPVCRGGPRHFGKRGTLTRLPSLEERIGTPAAKARHVRALFTTIAGHYDVITVLLSYGQDRRWKRRLVDLASPAKGHRALDLATGTGDIALGLSARGARVVGVDVSHRMIDRARVKASRSRTGAAFLVGDMLALPFPSGSFDTVTTGYGLRNAPDLTAAVDEIARVLKPGGQIVSLDFNRPSHPLVRAAYLRYLSVVGGALGWILHRDADTYRYIPASIRGYVEAGDVVRLLEARGFARVKYYPVLGGLMAIHQGFKS
jgi:demethylmenaquinone methyltransferase/2-methoxy-6-polyprenyl-1,4-benzoquinol methylase